MEPEPELDTAGTPERSASVGESDLAVLMAREEGAEEGVPPANAKKAKVKTLKLSPKANTFGVGTAVKKMRSTSSQEATAMMSRAQMSRDEIAKLREAERAIENSAIEQNSILLDEKECATSPSASRDNEDFIMVQQFNEDLIMVRQFSSSSALDDLMRQSSCEPSGLPPMAPVQPRRAASEGSLVEPEPEPCPQPAAQLELQAPSRPGLQYAWSWHSDTGWVPYPGEISRRLEAGYSCGATFVDLDGGRHVDMANREALVQRVTGDPRKYRRVKREISEEAGRDESARAALSGSMVRASVVSDATASEIGDQTSPDPSPADSSATLLSRFRAGLRAECEVPPQTRSALGQHLVQWPSNFEAERARCAMGTDAEATALDLLKFVRPTPPTPPVYPCSTVTTQG
jgi:hypothetical protein